MNKAIYHFGKVDSDQNGNPRYVYNLYINGDNDHSTLRVIDNNLGKFSKKHNGYIITYYGNEAQTAHIIEQIRVRAQKYTLARIA